MKGIIFNITEGFIIKKYGEEQLDLILSHCTLITKEPYVAPGTYPDEDLMEIVSKASKCLEISPDDFLVSLGRYSFSQLASRYSNFLTGFDNAKDFLKTIESVVHVEIQKLYTDAYLPTFQYKEPSENKLIITYYSKRKLYPLMQGLISGVGDHFNTSIKQRHIIYEKDGKEYCDFFLEFLPK